MEPGSVPVTPEGDTTLVDDFYGDKQLISVTTKAGNYFYIFISRANEDKKTAVHFLNQVADADMQALLEDGKAVPETCTTKCAAGVVNANYQVCKTNMTECAGPEQKPQEPKEIEQPQEDEVKSTGMGGLVMFLVVTLTAAMRPFTSSSLECPRPTPRAATSWTNTTLARTRTNRPRRTRNP